MRALAAAVLAGLSIGGWGIRPASAQYDPMASRAENHVGSLNRSMLQQHQFRSIQQQGQFETNQIRGGLARQPRVFRAPGLRYRSRR